MAGDKFNAAHSFARIQPHQKTSEKATTTTTKAEGSLETKVAEFNELFSQLSKDGLTKTEREELHSKLNELTDMVQNFKEGEEEETKTKKHHKKHGKEHAPGQLKKEDEAQSAKDYTPKRLEEKKAAEEKAKATETAATTPTTTSPTISSAQESNLPPELRDLNEKIKGVQDEIKGLKDTKENKEKLASLRQELESLLAERKELIAKLRREMIEQLASLNQFGG